MGMFLGLERKFYRLRLCLLLWVGFIVGKCLFIWVCLENLDLRCICVWVDSVVVFGLEYCGYVGFVDVLVLI